ncbi:MAG: c-type cytochrome [Alphaproteobacteria bacterium]
MADLEKNKIFAAVLIAGIIGLGSSILAEKLVEPEHLKEPAYKVEVKEEVGNKGGEAAKAETIEPIAPLLAKADMAKGESTAKLCGACHSFNQGGPNKVGPNLWNIVGNKHGHVEGFSYSKAILEKTGNWDYEELNHFLASPKSYAPGTKMSFAGLKKAEDRANMILWLRSLSDKPLPLP